MSRPPWRRAVARGLGVVFVVALVVAWVLVLAWSLWTAVAWVLAR